MKGHPSDVKKVSVTAAGHLWECKITEFVWELRIMVAVNRAVRYMLVSVSRVCTVFQAAKVQL